jgi:hypothetical protein
MPAAATTNATDRESMASLEKFARRSPQMRELHQM